MSAKLSLSGSKGSSSSSLSSFGDGSSFQALRRAVSEHSPCTTESTFSNTITTIATTITTPPSTIASSSKSQTSPHVPPPQLDATTLSSSASSPATTSAITSCSSSRPAITATTTTTSLSARPSLLLPPPPEDVIKLLLSTTTYIYNSLTRLIDTNNTLRRSAPRIPRDQPICRADVLRGAPYSSRTATAVEGSSSASCPNGITHDALHIVNSHRAFARAIKAEIARLNAALAHFSPLSQSLRLRSFFSSLPTSIGGSGLRMKVDKKHKCTGDEELTAWSDIKNIIYTYDWLWTYSYSASVENWQDIIWACAVVTGVYGAGGLEGVNARMRDYGIAHAGVVDGFYMADWAVEQGAERRQVQMERLGNRQDATIPGELRREVVIRRSIAIVDGKWVQVDPRVIVTEKKDEVVNRSQEVVGCAERRWKVKFKVPWSVVAVGLKIKVLRESIKGKDKCKKESKGKVQETIEEDPHDEEYEKAMWR